MKYILRLFILSIIISSCENSDDNSNNLLSINTVYVLAEIDGEPYLSNDTLIGPIGKANVFPFKLIILSNYTDNFGISKSISIYTSTFGLTVGFLRGWHYPRSFFREY